MFLHVLTCEVEIEYILHHCKLFCKWYNIFFTLSSHPQAAAEFITFTCLLSHIYVLIEICLLQRECYSAYENSCMMSSAAVQELSKI